MSMRIVTEAEQQFSAVEIVLDDGTSYISFRGTDDTIIGWKEDFNLSTGVVPAQERAVEYMQRISDKAYGMLRVGGHSKGGNLAVFAPCMWIKRCRMSLLRCLILTGRASITR